MNDSSLILEQIRRDWQESWPRSLKVWSPFVKLREPVWCLRSEEAAREGLTGSFAMIRLSDHRIVIDVQKVHACGVASFAVQVLAHEVGHHVYTPASLHDNALLLSRIRWGLADLEDRAPFVANLYADLLINDALHRTKNLDMAAVYAQLNRDADMPQLWVLIMRTYEYLWKLKRGTLSGPSHLHTPAIDADASLAASLLRSFAKRWLEGAGRYAALLYPYLLEEEAYRQGRASMVLHLDAEQAGLGGGLVAGLAQIDPEALAGAVDPRAEAVGAEKATAAGLGIGMGQAARGGNGPQQRYVSPGVYVDLQRQINPGLTDQDLINQYYREIALPHLISFPLHRAESVSMTLPEGTDTWEVSDPVEEIDWLQSALVSPLPLPGYSTRKRLYGVDEDQTTGEKALDVYIGIDCSGSMTNPRQGFSWPVLAAAVIGLSALRAGARVMACLSGEPGGFTETDGFTHSDKEVLTVLTSYLGTGYAYGIPRLEAPFGKKRPSKSHVVLVSDDDLFAMLNANTGAGESHWHVIASALQNAGGTGTIVLHSQREWHQAEVKRLQGMGWRVHYVTSEKQLLAFAAAFSQDYYADPSVR